MDGADAYPHVSFLTTYHEPTDELKKAAQDIEAQLNHEGEIENEGDGAQAGAAVGATTAITLQQQANEDVDMLLQVRRLRETRSWKTLVVEKACNECGVYRGLRVVHDDLHGWQIPEERNGRLEIVHSEDRGLEGRHEHVDDDPKGHQSS
ncbi:hypothetical protein ON010_g10220 [Phytophthora cinnamomi]|nr:hypothetical protein ON010_g10220 [Phytophthora cinnamomi]